MPPKKKPDVDHDALIRMEGQMTAMTVSIEAHNIASVERDTRIETQVKQINGSVGRHEGAIVEINLWKAKVQTIGAMLLLSGPFIAGVIVWALNHYLP